MGSAQLVFVAAVPHERLPDEVVVDVAARGRRLCQKTLVVGVALVIAGARVFELALCWIHPCDQPMAVQLVGQPLVVPLVCFELHPSALAGSGPAPRVMPSQEWRAF